MNDQNHNMEDDLNRLIEQSELEVIVPDVIGLSLENLQDQAGPNKEDEGTASERAAYLPGRGPLALRSSLYFGESVLFEKNVWNLIHIQGLDRRADQHLRCTQNIWLHKQSTTTAL